MAHIAFYFVLSICECAWTWPYVSNSSWLAVYPAIQKATWLCCCSIYPLNFFFIFWTFLMFLYHGNVRKKWDANGICVEIIWVDRIYAREYFTANYIWILRNNRGERRGTLPNSNEGGGVWNPGKQQSTKIPLGGYVPWVNDPLVPNEA